MTRFVLSGILIHMRYWEAPPRLKIYEALGAIGDARVVLANGGGRVQSSSGRKYYDVSYDDTSNEISSNDNVSYWVGYLGYPAVAYLIERDLISVDRVVCQWLAGIHWKDINTKYRNSHVKAEAYVRNFLLVERDADLSLIDSAIDSVFAQIVDLHLVKSGRPTRPPKGY